MSINANTPIQLVLNVEATNTVLGALGTLPYERVAGIINTIQQQAQQQVMEIQAKAEAEVTKAEDAQG